jgi:SAM-dependent methyltransferase
MTRPTSIHEEVSRAYTRAVTEPSPKGGCCSSAIPKGVVAKSAGYDPADLAALPADAVENSFGCGNPLGFSEVKEGDVVLDLGSGAGIDLLLAARKVGAGGRVIGVDMTDAMIERARANVEKAGLANVEVRKGLIEALPVDDASVDHVISNCVINLSPDKPAVFREIARVLRPGGRMRVSDIVVEALPGWVRNDSALYCSCVAGAVSETEYLDGLRQAGLVDVEVVDRIAYDADQLEAFVSSELPTEKSGCCGGTPAWMPDAAGIAREMAGKVWSVRVTARKP